MSEIVANNNNVNTEENKLTKKDLFKVLWLWFTINETCQGFERLQSLGVARTMVPVIDRLYKTREEKAAALKRHMVFFCCESNWGAFIIGLLCSMEEDKANGKPIDDEMINNVKIGLMGPISGFGDTMTQGLVRVVLLSIACDMTLSGNYFGPIFFMITDIAYLAITNYFTFTNGYRVGRNIISKISDRTIMKRVTETLSALGMTVAGAMIFAYANVATPAVLQFSETSIVLNELIDSLLPNMIGVITTLSVFALLRKGTSVFKIMIALFVLGFVLCALGIL